MHDITLGGESLLAKCRLVIERLLDLGSIPELAMRHCVDKTLIKTLDTYFLLYQHSLSIVVAQLDKKTHKQNQKNVGLYWCG